MLKSFDKTQGNFFEKNGLSVGLLFSHHFNMLNLSFYTSYSHLNSSFGHGKRLNFNTFTLKYRFNHIFVLGASKRVFREKKLFFFFER